MHEGYGSHSVCLCYQASCYIQCTSFASPNCGVIRFLMVFQTRIGWIPLITLCSLVLASSADDKLLDFSLSGTQRSIYTKDHVPVLYTVWSAHGWGKVKARPTEWSVCLELAVCKCFSGGKVSSSTVDCIVYASTYSVVYHACLTQRYYTMSMFHCQSLPISRTSWLLLLLAVHAAVNTFMWTTVVLRLSALVLSVSHHSGT